MSVEDIGGRSGTRRHASAAARDDSLIYSQLEPIGPRETVGGLLARNAERFPEKAVFCERRGGKFVGVTWEEFLYDVVSFERFLASCRIGKGDRVAVLSANRAEMLVVEFATMSLGAIYVPIFPGYPAEQAQALVEHAGAVALVIPDRDQLARVRVPESVRVIVSFDPIARASVAEMIGARDGVYVSFKTALRRHAVSDHDDLRLKMFLWSATRIDPGEPCLLMYTSGTTGELKGVLLTHDNILSQQRGLAALWDIGPDDRFLSYLPWHHSFGGIFEKYTALYNGATLYLDDSFGKDFNLLLKNWKDALPTVYFSVPKIYQQLVGHVQLHPPDEPRIFHQRLRFVFTAAAALPGNLSAYFQAHRIPVVEGWGLTETAPCCTLTDLAETRTPGMVGYPLPGVTVRLADDGEILVQGPNVMRGYFRNPAATARALPGDGWFHTGDLGELVGAGLKLVTRKDRVFKLLNAEKVVPTEIENTLAGMNKYIRHVIVTGDGRDYLAALIFPDFFLIKQEFENDREMAERVVKQSFLATVKKFNREHPVKYERLRAFAVISKELTIESDELTPSLKVRVRDVLRKAEKYVDAVYEPTQDCDCRFLRKVLRLGSESRRCFAGKDQTLAHCHECGRFVFGDQREQE